MAEPHICPWWLGWLHSIPLRKLMYDPKKLLKDFVRPGMMVLDVGCGPGFFSIPMAKMIGESGRVIAADLQSKMLDFTRRRARRAKVQSRIEFHQREADKVGVDEKVDFIAAFYVVHELPNQRSFFQEMKSILKPGGRLFVMEPRNHVTEKKFEVTMQMAVDAGFIQESAPKVRGSRSSVFAVSK